MDHGHLQHDGGSSDEESEMEWEEVDAGVGTAQQHQHQPQASTSTGKINLSATDSDAVEVTLRPSTVVSSGKAGSKGKGKGRPAGFSLVAQLERANRQELHKTHTCCLLVAGHVRNGWLNDRALQARLLSKTPLEVQNRFHDFSKATHPRATDRSRAFEAAMRHLMHWWHEHFWFDDTQKQGGSTRGEPNLMDLLAAPHSIRTEDHLEMLAMINRLSNQDRIRLMMPFCEDEDLEKLVEKYPSSGAAKGKGTPKKKQKLPRPLSAELGELIRNPQSLAKRAVQMVGTRDMSAQLFTALCRSLDIPARLVCSLPVLDHRSANRVKSDEKLANTRTGGSTGRGSSATPKKRKFDQSHTEDSDEPDFEEVKIPNPVAGRAMKRSGATGGNASDSSATSRRSVGRPKKDSRQPNASEPVIDIDEVSPTVPTFWTEVYNRSLQEWVTVDVVRNKFRPRKGEMDNGRLFYVVAYEVDQYIKDVTPRYAKSFSGRTLKMRISNRRKEEPDWWDEALVQWQRPFSLGREVKEDEDLARHQDAEPMPTVLEGFKNHPRYVLERHLKREEVLLPKTKQFGLFRGEPVFPRSSVVSVKSAENWMREGRQIKDGEQAMKMVKQRAVTINRRRAQEMAMQEGQEPLMQGLYSRNQTQLVIPEPVVDGKVPKNSYGNLDLFAPHMLPRGGVHLPHKNIRKVAKELGIDFAEAITGFEFHKRRAVPTVSGIVIPKEHKEMVLEAFWATETAAAEKEADKRKARALKKWKKLIIGLRVRSRIQGEYKSKQNQSQAEASSAGGKAGPPEGVSQFGHVPQEEAPKRKKEVKQEEDVPDPSATAGGFIHTDSLHPLVPGGAAFPAPGKADDSQMQLNGAPEIDINDLHLPPMPMPAPAAEQSSAAEPDADAISRTDFAYPPQTQLNENGSIEHAGNAIQPADVELDGFTLADPEDVARGAPEVAEADGEEILQGGFVRDEDEDVEKPVDAVPVRSTSRNKHKQPEHMTSPPVVNEPPTDDQDEDTDDFDMHEVVANVKPRDGGVNGILNPPSKAVRNSSLKTESSEEDDDHEQAESDEYDQNASDDEKDYEPTAPARSSHRGAAARPVRSTRNTHGTATSETKSNPKASPRRSSRQTISAAATSSASKPTRASARSAKRTGQQNSKYVEDASDQDMPNGTDGGDSTAESVVQVATTRATRSSDRKTRGQRGDGKSNGGAAINSKASEAGGKPARATRAMRRATVTQLGTSSDDDVDA